LVSKKRGVGEFTSRQALGRGQEGRERKNRASLNFLWRKKQGGREQLRYGESEQSLANHLMEATKEREKFIFFGRKKGKMGGKT